MPFFGRKEPPALTAQETLVAKLKDQSAAEIAQADASELVKNLTTSCFDLCYGNNLGGAPTSGQEKCVRDCAQKFMSAWNLTSAVFLKRLEQRSS